MGDLAQIMLFGVLCCYAVNMCCSPTWRRVSTKMRLLTCLVMGLTTTYTGLAVNDVIHYGTLQDGTCTCTRLTLSRKLGLMHLSPFWSRRQQHHQRLCSAMSGSCHGRIDWRACATCAHEQMQQGRLPAPLECFLREAQLNRNMSRRSLLEVSVDGPSLLSWDVLSASGC